MPESVIQLSQVEGAAAHLEIGTGEHRDIKRLPTVD